MLRALICGAAAVVVLAPGGAAHADPSQAQVQAQIDQADNDFEKIVEAYNASNENLKATQAAADALNAKMKPIQDQMDAAYGNVSSIAVAAYKGSGRLSTVSIVLSAGSSDSMVSELATLRHLSQARQRELDGYTALQQQYNQEKTRLADLLAKQTADQQSLVAQKATIEAKLQGLKELRQRLNVPAKTTSSRSSATNNGPPPAVSGAAGRAVSFAYAQLGKPYGWGAAGPDSYDCSGLTMRAWEAAGVSLPHNAASQYSQVRHVSRDALAPGDLVFANSLGHVGIFIGDDTMIDAPHSGADVRKISISSFSIVGYGRPG
jgi:cell wall-associated NlpC family hydrolase